MTYHLTNAICEPSSLPDTQEVVGILLSKSFRIVMFVRLMSYVRVQICVFMCNCYIYIYILNVKPGKTLTIDATVETLSQGFHSTAIPEIVGDSCKCM